jgi:hypothetical protein
MEDGSKSRIPSYITLDLFQKLSDTVRARSRKGSELWWWPWMEEESCRSWSLAGRRSGSQRQTA